MTPPTVRGVRQGDAIAMPVAGGYHRRPAPCDGLYVETDDTALFIELSTVEAALAGMRGTARVEPLAVAKKARRR